MRRIWIGCLGVGAAACLSDPPPLAQDGTGSTGGPTTSGPTTAASTAPTTAGDDGSSSSSSSSSSSGSSSTGGPSVGDCEKPLSPLATNEGSGTVQNAGFEVIFDIDTNNGMPSVLRSKDGSGNNLLFTDGGVLERLAGVLHFPSWASWQSSAAPSVTWPENNRVVTQIEIDWQIPGGEIMGNSTYTVIADGRIVRDEAVTVVAAGGTLDWLVAYVAIDPSRITHVEYGVDMTGTYDLSSGPLMTLPPSFLTAGPADRIFACAYHEMTTDTVGWVPHVLSVSGAGARASHPDNGAGNPSVALQYDWFRDADVPEAEHNLFAMMSIDGGGRAHCACVAGQFEAYLLPPSMGVDAGGQLASDDPGDLDADGYNEATGWYTATLTGSSITFHVADDLPAGALFKIRNFSASTASVTIDDTPLVEDQDYLIDAGSNGAAFLMLGQLLNGVASVVVTPR